MKALVALVFSLFFLAGCGQKGDLYHPAASEPVQTLTPLESTQ